jgi:hypothetical protein
VEEKILPMAPLNDGQRESILAEREKSVSAALSAITVFTKILAIRSFLFLSLLGSFALSIIATNNQSMQSSVVLVLYACVTTLPLTIIEWKGRNGG